MAERQALRALAEGGQRGLDAYEASVANMRDQQRHAIDLALDSPVKRVPSEFQQELRQTVKMPGDVGVAALHDAKRYHTSSMDRLSQATDAALSQYGTASSLAAGEGSEVAAERRRREAATESLLDQVGRSEEEDRAVGRGLELRLQAMADAEGRLGELGEPKPWTDDQRVEVFQRAFGGEKVTPTRQRQVTSPEAYYRMAEGLQRKGHGTPELIADYIEAGQSLEAQLAREAEEERRIEASLDQRLGEGRERSLLRAALPRLDAGLADPQYQRQAYMEMGADPYSAYGRFPDLTPGGERDQLEDMGLALPPAQQRRAENEQRLAEEEAIAALYGLPREAVVGAAEDARLPDDEVFRMLLPDEPLGEGGPTMATIDGLAQQLTGEVSQGGKSPDEAFQELLAEASENGAGLGALRLIDALYRPHFESLAGLREGL